MNLSELTDNELLALSQQRECNELTRSLLSEARQSNSMHILQEDADGFYWKRRLTRIAALADPEVDELLAKPLFSSARSLLGEAARDDKLTDEQLARVYEASQGNKFVSKQIKSRQLLRRAIADIQRSGRISDLLREMVKLGTVWPVVDTCAYLDSDELRKLESELDLHGISRQGRHHIREAIKERRVHLGDGKGGGEKVRR